MMSGLIWKLLLASACCSLTEVAAQQLVTIDTSLGRISGTQNSIRGDEYSKFLGIPYGTAERLQKPEPYGNFASNPLIATSYGPPCPQFSNGQIIGSEDCLTLNVFTPKRRRRDGLKSVMIWIHGGGLTTGSGDKYPLDVLAAANDVVAVSLNYRLGAFGFLSSPNDGLPGNYGLWDQQLAIMWVKNNIADYGGDPNSITLVGESVGAIAVTYHMISPTTPPNLFHRGITQSGSAFSLRFQDIRPEPNFQFVSTTFGCNGTRDELACIRAIPMNSLLASTPTLMYNPAIDGDFISPLFGEHLVQFTKDNYLQHGSQGLGNFLNYDILSGWNTMDGLVYVPAVEAINRAITGQDLSQGISEFVFGEVFKASSRGSFSESADLITTLALQFYMNEPTPLISKGRSIDDRRLEAFVNFFGDIGFKIPSITHLQIHSKTSSRRTYAYEFTYNPPGNGLSGSAGPEWLNAAANHRDEVPFVIGAVLAPESICSHTGLARCGRYNRREERFATNLMNHWTRFAKTGRLNNKFKQFRFRGGQSYMNLNINGTRRDTYPRSAAHRFSAGLDEIALRALGI